jgi:hypothetical protein
MLKKTITYEDFNGETMTEDHFFHLSKADLIELEMSTEGGMEARLKKIVEIEDNRQIYAEFKKILLLSYGLRSDDGKRFIKTEAIRDEFVSSEAFSTLLMELLSDENAAAAFMNGVIPHGLSKDILVTNTSPAPAVEATKGIVLTREELLEIDGDELRSGLATGKYILGA